MLQRKNKKGFTLAELLIVVAILAVLTAIAVPLFVGALDNAKEATRDANVRAVRGAAAVAILEADVPSTPATADAKDPKGVYYPKSDGAMEKPSYTWAFPDKWKVVAVLTTSGEVTSITLTPDTEQADVVYDESTKGQITITLGLKITEVTKAS